MDLDRLNQEIASLMTDKRIFWTGFKVRQSDIAGVFEGSSLLHSQICWVKDAANHGYHDFNIETRDLGQADPAAMAKQIEQIWRSYK